MKVTTDACLFGAWAVENVGREKLNISRLLDIGTGTGLLTLMCAQKNPEVEIDAVEIDEEAATQAHENIDATPWKKKIFVTHGDAKTVVKTLGKDFDVIISNPPFYEKEIRSETKEKNVAHHSTDLTLDNLLTIIKGNLTSKGSFFLLLPYKRKEEINRLFKDHELCISRFMLVRQSVKHDYFRIMIKGKLNPAANEETEFDEISIWDAKQEYTPEFTNYLKDYYLLL